MITTWPEVVVLVAVLLFTWAFMRDLNR